MNDDANADSPRWPDPTTLTTQQMLREVASLKELLLTRMDAMDHATTLRIETWHDEPKKMRDLVQNLEQLHAEKFSSIAQQFAERDTRTEQATSSGAQALAAALQAAKELVGAQGEASAAAAVKSETSFTKQIDQIGTIIQTLEKALDARITELKERIDRGEGNASGVHEVRANNRLNVTAIIAAGGLFLALIGTVITLIVVSHA